MINVALYARVSSERQEKEGTIDSQIAQLRQFAKSSGYVIVQEYLDDGYSGDLLARPALDKLRDDAAKGIFEGVLIFSIDRLARNWVYGQVISDELRKKGITVQYLNHKDDGTEESRLMLGIQGLFGQYEKAKIIERSRRGRLFGAKAGRLMTSRAPYGYRYVARNGAAPARFEIHDEEARIVRLIFELCAQGFGFIGISTELDRRQIPTPTGTKFWAKSTLSVMLRNETYAGVWHYNKKIAVEPSIASLKATVRRRLHTSQIYRARDQWVQVNGVPPILDRELFDSAQIQLTKNFNHYRIPRGRFYLLSGLCECAVCGRKLYGLCINGRYLYYRCHGTHAEGPKPAVCHEKAVPSPKLETTVWGRLVEALKNPRLIMQEMERINQTQKKARSSMDSAREEVAKQRGKLQMAETRLLDAYSAGAVTLDQLKSQMERVREQKADLDKRDVDLNAVPSKIENTNDFTDQCRKIARGLKLLEKDQALKQKFLRGIVSKIVIYADRAVVFGALPAILPATNDFRALSPSL